MKKLINIFINGILGLLVLSVGFVIGLFLLWIGKLLYEFSGWAFAVGVLFVLILSLGTVIQKINDRNSH